MTFIAYFPFVNSHLFKMQPMSLKATGRALTTC